MKPTTKIRTVAALRKAAANHRAVTGWSAAKPDVEKPAAWVLRMPFDRVTEALASGMAIYVPKVRKGERGECVRYRDLIDGERIHAGDQYLNARGVWTPQIPPYYGAAFSNKQLRRHRRPIGKGSR